MELVELTLSNFKKFADEQFRFSPGLNLLWGPNESGKSTIHEAICCALFGRERGRAVENWNGGSCSVELTYRSGRKSYRIERRLTEGASKFGALTRGELTDVISDKDEIGRILAGHLGIASRSVFDNTVSIRQTDMSKPEASDMEPVGGEIQRVLTGTAHISAAEVLKRLEAKRGDVKGKARPTNPREYDDATQRLGKLAEDLADARRSRNQIRNLEEELGDLEAKVARDSERLEILEALLERHRKWSDLKKKEAEEDSAHQSVFATAKKLSNTLEDLRFAQKELAGYAHLVGKDDEVEEQLSKIGSRRGELEARLAELKVVGQEEPPIRRGLASALLLAVAILTAFAGCTIGFLLDQRGFLLLVPASLFAIWYMRVRGAGGSAEFKQLAELADSARRELKQLASEEKNILTYVKCQDAGKALGVIKSYRKLAAQARELEVTLRALLGERTLEDWQAKEADLDRDLTSIRRELADEFPDYSPATEEVEGWRSEHAALQRSQPAAQARLHEVRGSLESERRNARDLASLEGEIEFLHGRKSELEFVHRAYEEAAAALARVMETVSGEYLPALCEQASGYLEQVTSGRYASICVKPDWQISVDCRDKSAVLLEALSIGTLDQLHFALRIACGELLSAGQKLPLILDDPFANFDRGRLDNVLNLLGVLARENQILLLTHDPYVLDWAGDLASSGSVPCLVRELPGPTEGREVQST